MLLGLVSHARTRLRRASSVGISSNATAGYQSGGIATLVRSRASTPAAGREVVPAGVAGAVAEHGVGRGGGVAGVASTASPVLLRRSRPTDGPSRGSRRRSDLPGT